MSNEAHALEHQAHADSTDVFGFWIYILTDCILFSCLFATYVVLHHPGAYGPALKKHIELPYVLGETFFLLASNFTFGLGILSMNKNQHNMLRFWLIITFILGAGFVGMEIHEFFTLAAQGYTPQVSGAASSFFVLVGTHGFHVSMGLLWMLVMLIQVSFFKVTPAIKRRLTYLGLFWNFLDIVWIFLFTVVYLLGAV